MLPLHLPRGVAGPSSLGVRWPLLQPGQTPPGLGSCSNRRAAFGLVLLSRRRASPTALLSEALAAAPGGRRGAARRLLAPACTQVLQPAKSPALPCAPRRSASASRGVLCLIQRVRGAPLLGEAACCRPGAGSAPGSGEGPGLLRVLHTGHEAACLGIARGQTLCRGAASCWLVPRSTCSKLCQLCRLPQRFPGRRGLYFSWQLQPFLTERREAQLPAAGVRRPFCSAPRLWRVQPGSAKSCLSPAAVVCQFMPFVASN